MARNWTVALLFFFFNDTATTEIYTLSLHDALPISVIYGHGRDTQSLEVEAKALEKALQGVEPESTIIERSEEHTSELQSRLHLVCRLLLEKKQTLRSVGVGLRLRDTL